MTYPTFNTVIKQQNIKKGEETEQLFNMIAECMYQIWQGEETFDVLDYSEKEK